MTRLAMFMALAGICGFAQTEKPLAFEVASVKENKSGDPRTMGYRFLPGARFVATNMPLTLLIAVAYNLPSFNLSNRVKFASDSKPDPRVDARYDIEARAEKGAIPAGMTTQEREAKMRLMLQTLLRDRFKMRVRTEIKEASVYELVVAKNGPKLQKSQMQEKDCTAAAEKQDNPLAEHPPCHVLNGGMGRGLHGKSIDMEDVILFVANWTDKPVVDRTGLKDLYDVETDGWVPLRPRQTNPGAEPSAEDLAMADPARPTLFMIFDRLGLKLESSKAPIESYVIEHAERPTEN